MRLGLGGLLLAVIVNFVFGFMVVSILLPEQPTAGVEISRDNYGERWPFEMKLGWLRCEGAGAVIFNVQGKDYAVNGMASSRYAPIKPILTRAKAIDIGPIISRGLTLCHW